MRAQESGCGWHDDPGDLPAVGAHVEIETVAGETLRGEVMRVWPDAHGRILLGGWDAAPAGMDLHYWDTWADETGADDQRVRWRYAPKPGCSTEDALDRQRREAVEWAESRWASLTPEARAAVGDAAREQRRAAGLAASGFAVGDIVRPRQADTVLRSGCSLYADAIVLSVEPFHLVSRAGDMLWTCTVTPGDFELVGPATASDFERGRHRSLTDGLVKQ